MAKLLDYASLLKRKLALLVFAGVAITTVGAIGLWLLTAAFFADMPLLHISLCVIGLIILVSVVSAALVRLSYQPLKLLSDIIVFAGHSSRGGLPPELDGLLVGKELISSLAAQVYDLGSMSHQTSDVAGPPSQAATEGVVTVQPALAVQTATAAPTTPHQPLIEQIGIPIIGISSSQHITTMNAAAAQYLTIDRQAAQGGMFYDVAKLSFPSEITLEAWIKDRQQHAVNDSRVWEQVRILLPDNKTMRQFDLVAQFSKENPSGTETMLALFDRSRDYARSDQEISFVSLAVHELRTPLTVMKGYIEVFEDEVGPTLNEEMADFMHKMKAAAQQLTAFVGNILNVARIEENQLTLKLARHDWADILKTAARDLALRAQVQGKRLELRIATNLPPVAVDRISIHEVVNNLVDNAIKYAGDSDLIIISTALNSEGLVQTDVQDFGIGIPTAVMPDLFQKFYRSHKSRVQVGGTGLGLYLCKAVVNAHSGNIWVHSKEGEGSTFSFTVQPYDKVKHQAGDGEDGIMRGAHGWIKNHSLNRQ